MSEDRYEGQDYSSVIRDFIPADEEPTPQEARREGSVTLHPTTGVRLDYVPPKGEKPVKDVSDEQKRKTAQKAADAAQERQAAEDARAAKERMDALSEQEAIAFVETQSGYMRDVHLRAEAKSMKRKAVLDAFPEPGERPESEAAAGTNAGQEPYEPKAGDETRIVNEDDTTDADAGTATGQERRAKTTRRKAPAKKNDV